MKYCCLDIGNVICKTDFTPFLRDLSKSLNITIEEGSYFMNRTQKLHDLGITMMADELKDHFKVKSPVIVEEILNSWNSLVIPNMTVIKKFEKMQDKGVQIALLSNIGIEHAKMISSKLGRTQFFKKSIKHFSCEVGARKPSMLYYQSFLMQHPEFKGCVYVDDLQENLDASKQFEFQTVKFDLNDYYKGGSYVDEAFADTQVIIELDKIEDLILKSNS